jgi:hypothetical protein
MQRIIDMGVFEDFVFAIDHIAGQRNKMGTFEHKDDHLNDALSNIRAEPVLIKDTGTKEVVAA